MGKTARTQFTHCIHGVPSAESRHCQKCYTVLAEKLAELTKHDRYCPHCGGVLPPEPKKNEAQRLMLRKESDG